MRFPLSLTEGIASGAVTLAFRRWERPLIRAGGRQRSPAGELRIVSVDAVETTQVSEADARRAGYPSLEAFLREPHLDRPGALWRIAFTRHADPRIELRGAIPDISECTAILDRLAAKAARADFDPLQRLVLIRDNPARRAPDLALQLGLETRVFKRQIRQLKELGLTESLRVGYRLSPRGEAVLKHSGC